MSKVTGPSMSKFPALGKGGKKATTLFLMPTLLSRLSRRLPRDKSQLIRRVARKPWKLVDHDTVRAACQVVMASVGEQEHEKIKILLAKRKPTEVFTLWHVLRKCGNTDESRPEWLIPCPKDQLPKPAKEAFPKRDLQQLGTPGKGPSQNRIKIAAAARISGGTGTKNAPEELYFKSTKILVANRNALPGKILKKLARKPYKEFN